MSNIRKKAEAALSNLTQADVDELVARGLGQQKKVWRTITCRHCKRQSKVEVDLPTPNTAKAIRDLGEFVHGKVPEEVRVRVSHSHELPPSLRDLTTEELLAHREHLAAQLEAEDAEFTDVKELPAG